MYRMNLELSIVAEKKSQKGVGYGLDAIRRGEVAQRKRCRDPRCSPRGNPACRVIFLSREGRDLGVAFQAPPGSQASSRSGGEKGLRGSGAGTLGVPLGPREFHGQRSLMGYSPLGHKESDTTAGAASSHP